MKTRVIAALAGIPPVLAAVFLAGPATFGAIVLALALLALHEYLSICAVEPLIKAAVLACAVPALVAVPVGEAPGVWAGAMLVLALISLWRVEDPARRFRGLAEGVLGLCYIGYAMGCLWMLRMGTAHGAAWLFLVLGATWAGDSAAYFVGSRFGRRRFSPNLSPNKTWAGAVGGLSGSLAGGLLSLPLFAGEASVWFLAATSLAVGLTGQLGDLFESLWKRAKGVKDSGNLIPGHGGILDRIDSLLIGIPVGYHIVRVWGP
ncbi:MAG: phosphatidate cytidylyltransferase [Candidatus Methylomirabilia bacterium]